VSAGPIPPRPGQILARGLAADAPGRRLISVAAYVTGSGSLPSFDDASLERQALDFIRSTPARAAAIVYLQPAVYELRFVFPRAYPDTAANATKLELMASAIAADLARRAKAAGLAGRGFGVEFDPCPWPLPRWPREFVQHGLECEPKQWLERFGVAPPSPAEIEAFEQAEAAELAVRLEEAKAFAAMFAEATRRAPRASEAAVRTGEPRKRGEGRRRPSNAILGPAPGDCLKTRPELPEGSPLALSPDVFGEKPRDLGEGRRPPCEGERLFVRPLLPAAAVARFGVGRRHFHTREAEQLFADRFAVLVEFVEVYAPRFGVDRPIAPDNAPVGGATVGKRPRRRKVVVVGRRHALPFCGSILTGDEGGKVDLLLAS
jgi:hypothetical protein